jgi:hypothetical protein
MGEIEMTDFELGIFKQALATARAPGVAAPVGAIWRVINLPNSTSAVNFINAPPPQKAGEAAYSNREDGTVDTYFFL